jgi:glutamine synthetase
VSDTPRDRPTDATTLLRRLDADGIEHLWVVYHDYLGRAAGKVVPRASFRSAVLGGVVFAKANLNFDHRDHQVEGAVYLANSGDFLAVPDPTSYAVLPQFRHTARVHAFMRADDGSAWDGCPRTRLASIIDVTRKAGYSIQVALEPEFYITHRTDDGRYSPTNRSPMFSTAGIAAEEPFLRRVLELLDGMGVEVPQIGQEYSPGQYELSTRHGDPLTAIDNYYAVREAVRDAASEHGYEATFMPKPYADWAGNSLHVHLSIWNAEDTTDLTPQESDETSISILGGNFIGGILAHVEALTGLGSPTVNSYKRLQPGSWAPANSYWGYNNRSGVIRVPGSGKRRHIEYRASDNSAQPEMLLTGLISAGMHGIRESLDPGAPFWGDIGHMTAEEIAAATIGELPRTLDVALDALEQDDVIAEALGSSLVESVLLLRRHELGQYQLQVHDWERETYFRIP